MGKKLTKEQVAERIKVVHKNRYCYNDSIYLGYDTKMAILCNIHGIFYQTPNNHLQGKGCKECNNAKPNNNKYTQKQIVDFFTEKHGDTYDYSYVNYESIIKKSNNYMSRTWRI